MGLPATKANLPPMMVRYLEYKERYPDALLFFQVGDFYELFYDDAVTVAKTLNLTLTSRDKNSPEPIPMCGVPLSVLDGYVDRLLPLGFSVAVVSQTGSGQGVDRALERFVTPGMRLFTSVSSDSTESLVAAVALDADGRHASVVATDPQTGSVQIKDAIEVNTLPRELAAWMAREVVLPRSAHGEKVDRRSGWVRSVESAVSARALRFRPEQASSGEIDRLLDAGARAEFHALSPTGKRAVRLLLAYLDEISLGNPLPIREISLQRDTGVVVIDAATRKNLELVQNTKDGSSVGTLFGFLNSTQTPGGARLLKSWLISPLMDETRILSRQQAIEELLPEYSGIHSILAGLGDLERLAARIQLNVASPKDLGAVRDTLERIPELQDRLSHCKATVLRDSVDALQVPYELRALLAKALVDNPPHVLNDGGVIRDGYDAELDEIRNTRAHADQWRNEFEARERQTTGIATLKVRSNNVIGYFLEIPTAHSAKAPAHYQRRQSTANAERFTTPELKKHEDSVITAVDRQVRREQQLFVELRDRAKEYVETIRAVAKGIAVLDVLSALARVAEEYRWVCPSISSDTSLSIEAGRHPIIEKMLGGSFIPNSVAFGSPDPSCYIVTGPNMGGKSTYLRQIAIITVLAQIGSFVPATRATVGLVDRIFARLGSADDLHEGESTFMVEMREAAHILAHATDRSLVLIDELGRGTATTDGQSLAHAILEELALRIGCRTLFATHYHELTALDARSTRIQNLSVGSVEEEDRVVFTHAIQAGPAPRSYGLEVAKLSGLSSNVISRAAEILTDLAANNSKGASSQTLRQQSLFAPPPPKPAPAHPRLERIREVLTSVEPDNLSARDALALVYSLKEQLQKGS